MRSVIQLIPNPKTTFKYHATVVAMLLWLFGIWSHLDAAQEDQPKRVLLLYSHQTSSPINAEWDRGIRAALANCYPQGVKFDVEHLDLDRHEDVGYGAILQDYLRLKYADKQIDLVIPLYAQAYMFVMENRGLFQNAAVVGCSVPVAVAERYRGADDATGVVFSLNIVDTVELAIGLFPHARRLLVLSGTSKGEVAVRLIAQRVLKQFEDEIEIEYAEGLPLADYASKIAELEHQTIVLMLVHGTDVHGRTHTTVETVQFISKQRKAPVFGLYDTLLGNGIVGGKLASAEHQGELAGRLAARVLNGESAGSIPFVGLDTNEFVFDARQLNRWGISENLLPEASIVRNKGASIWQQYGTYLLAVLTAITLQSLVIVYLFVNRNRRIRVERSLQRSQTQASDLAGKLLSAQEDEQRRLARELHDDLTQRIAASAIMAARLEQQEKSSEDFRPMLSRLKQDLIQISEDVHLISRQIHPSIVDDLGISDALRSLCNRLADRIESEVTYRCGDIPHELPRDVTSCLYRIAQEAIQNAAKHSMTQRIEVTLSGDDEGIYLEVHDSGVGFDLSTSSGGLGLESMAERARLVNGKLDIESAIGKGTTIIMNLPISDLKP